ncbi:hypothetical protein MZP69_000717 [Klebsiella oxytoca]|nr:hypothetical protein [Klebsiella oxytoca]
MADMDIITKRINSALNIVLFSYPKRTSFGLLIGFFPMMFVYTFRNTIETQGISVEWIHYVACELLGVLVMNAKSIYEAFNGSSIDEVFSNTLKAIEVNPALTPYEKRQLIIKTLTTQIESLSTEQVEEVKKQVVDD